MHPLADAPCGVLDSATTDPLVALQSAFASGVIFAVGQFDRARSRQTFALHGQVISTCKIAVDAALLEKMCSSLQGGEGHYR